MQGLCYAILLLALVSSTCTAQTLRIDSVRTSSGDASIPSADGVRIPTPSTGDIDAIVPGLDTVTMDSNHQTFGVTSAPGGAASNVADTDTVHAPWLAIAIEGDTAMGTPRPAASPPRKRPGKGTDGREEGEVRLVNQVDVNGYVTGTLQVYVEGAWGAVCNAGFDAPDARVACRQLGFASGLVMPRDNEFDRRQFIPEPEELVPFVIENLGCAGDESSLLDCSASESIDYIDRDYRYLPDDSRFRTQSYNFACEPNRGNYVMVICGTGGTAGGTADDGVVRLGQAVSNADGSAEYGRLEVFYQGGWGTVCDNTFFTRSRLLTRPTVRLGFEQPEAHVACRQLGFENGFKTNLLADADPKRTSRVPIVLSDSECLGSEESLGDCPNYVLGRAPRRCDHDSDVHLVCFNGLHPGMEGRTRLMGGTSGDGYEYGRLEIFARGFWSNVCNSGRFTPAAAQVACRALGYDGGASLRFTQPYADSLSQVLFEDIPVALAAVDCEGNETSIMQCTSNDRQIRNCNAASTSTVLACANSAAKVCEKQEGDANGAARLRGGFGTLCDTIYTGFVEVLRFGEWGSICTDQEEEDASQDWLVADVVCRQLGFPHGTRVNPLTARPPPDDDAISPGGFYYYAYSTEARDFGDDTLPEEAEGPAERFWLRGVTCAGPEQTLVECNLGQGFLADNAGCGLDPHRLHIACRQFPVVEALEHIDTAGAVEGDLRLVEQAKVGNWVTGRPQVFFEGSWSQVCAGRFDNRDANVACRQLGFGAGTALVQELSREQPEVNVFPEIALTGLNCTGTEKRLVDCETDPFVLVDLDLVKPPPIDAGCQSSISNGLVLGCVHAPENGTEGEFRLTNKTSMGPTGAESGILEVFHAGAWGTVCGGDILEGTSQIACPDMGFALGSFEGAKSSESLLPPWLSGIQCSGSESELGACKRSKFGDTNSCKGNAILWLVCRHAGQGPDTRDARLVEGSTDPAGAWAYGRLEILISGIWSVIEDASGDSRTERFGRRGTEVACQSLGYATGAQLLVGESSPFPVPFSDVLQVALIIECTGSEVSLSECDIQTPTSDDHFSSSYPSRTIADKAVALICTTPSGCLESEVQPVEGDIRLVPLNGTKTPTARCDDVHFGGVELFRDGRWGRICVGVSELNHALFTLDAQVVCRQLGFPFGTVMDDGEIPYIYDVDYDYATDGPLVWANEVVCTGREDRLLDCDFPEDFGYNNGGTPSRCFFRGGLDSGRLAVVCRSFEIAESEEIRR